MAKLNGRNKATDEVFDSIFYEIDDAFGSSSKSSNLALAIVGRQLKKYEKALYKLYLTKALQLAVISSIVSLAIGLLIGRKLGD